jgi:hypothetical protein
MDLNYFYKSNSPLYDGLEKLFIEKDFFDEDHINQIRKLAKDCHDFWFLNHL